MSGNKTQRIILKQGDLLVIVKQTEYGPGLLKEMLLGLILSNAV